MKEGKKYIRGQLNLLEIGQLVAGQYLGELRVLSAKVNSLLQLCGLLMPQIRRRSRTSGNIWRGGGDTNNNHLEWHHNYLYDNQQI